MSDKNSLTVKNAKHKVIPYVESPNISPSDEVRIGLFFTGYGVPDKSKLYINLFGFDLDSDTDIQITKNIVSGKGKDDHLHISAKKEHAKTYTKSAEEGKTLVTNVGPELFLHKPEEPGKYTYKPTHGELGVPEAPLEIRFKVSEDIKPGDYTINFGLIYGDKEHVEEVVNNNAEIHVMNWYERNIRWIKPASIIIALLTVIIALLSFSLNIAEFFNLSQIMLD